MNKLLHIFLAILLLISTAGITIDKHYCGGNHTSTWLYPHVNACCTDIDDETRCCFDDITIYSIEDDFQYVSSTVSPRPNLVFTPAIFASKKKLQTEDRLTRFFYGNLNKNFFKGYKIYINVCSFLI